MLSQKSLRSEFALKLLPIFAALVFGFSYLIYSMIEESVFGELRREMIEKAQDFIADEDHDEIFGSRIDATVVGAIDEIEFHEVKAADRIYLQLEYPHLSRGFRFTKDITIQAELMADIRRVMLIANLISLVLIPVIAGLYSYFLARPIRAMTEHLAEMDERSVSPLAIDKLVPSELKPLTRTLNRLLARIESHITYQRELFVGIAHELKTPLAVIRAKNDVTLLKPRAAEKYQEVLRETNRIINDMNKMTKTVLELGRAEYAQFDPPETIDISEFLAAKAEDFALVASEQGRVLCGEISPKSLAIQTRPTLIEHIVQNFLGNALKFTPVGKKITLKSRVESGDLIIEVIDEGGGVEEGFDPFAPFVGKGEQKGTGLGLYLAKSAAIALDGTISLQNRDDKSGAIAKFVLPQIKPIRV